MANITSTEENGFTLQQLKDTLKMIEGWIGNYETEKEILRAEIAKKEKQKNDSHI